MHTREINIGQHTLSIETGKLAKQADGAVIVRYGDTMVLVTACHAANPREGIDFLPLTVDYREYTYASGRIPGGFFKREGKPTEKEVLTSRADRPADPAAVPGRLALRDADHRARAVGRRRERLRRARDHRRLGGAGAVEIPFQKTIAGVRVGLVDGAVRHQPDVRAAQAEPPRPHRRRQQGRHRDGRGRREGSDRGRDRPGARSRRTRPSRRSSPASTTLAKEAGKTKLRGRRRRKSATTSTARSRRRCSCRSTEAMRIADKLENYGTRRPGARRPDRVASPRARSQRKVEAKAIFKELKEKVLRDEILERGVRLDGRKFDEIRPIWIEVGVLPRTHGSAVFTRGETQALVTATLGTADDQQKIETVDGETYKRFMLHYNFPPFSVGEVAVPARPRPPRDRPRRARRARARADDARPKSTFPYTIRIVSDILESNGSSSMASVCGGSLAMMDAGVPLKAPVAGIAMGLIMDEKTGKYAVLTDIAGAEDHYGDMDFKVAGTADGHHRAADGHQGRRHHGRDHARGARAGARRAGCTSSARWQKTLPAPRGRHLDVRAAHRHDQDSGRQDPRRHRTRRQDDPQHHRADRREDRRRGRRPRERRVGRRGVGAEGHRHHPGADRDARAQQDLHGQGAAHHRLRRVRRDHARHRRPAARLRDRALTA